MLFANCDTRRCGKDVDEILCSVCMEEKIDQARKDGFETGYAAAQKELSAE